MRYLFTLIILFFCAPVQAQSPSCTLCGDLISGFWSCCAELAPPDCSDCAGSNCILCPDGSGGFMLCCFSEGITPDCSLCTVGGGCTLCDIVELLELILAVLIDIFELLDYYLQKILETLLSILETLLAIYHWLVDVPAASLVASDIAYVRNLVAVWIQQQSEQGLGQSVESVQAFFSSVLSALSSNPCQGVSSSRDVVYVSVSTPSFSFGQNSSGYNVLPSTWFVPDNPRLALFPASVSVSSGSFAINQWHALNLCSSRFSTLGTIGRWFSGLVISLLTINWLRRQLSAGGLRA